MGGSEGLGTASVRRATAAMPTSGEEKLSSIDPAQRDGGSCPWVTLMMSGFCWHDSSCVPARSRKKLLAGSSFSHFGFLLLLAHTFQWISLEQRLGSRKCCKVKEGYQLPNQ